MGDNGSSCLPSHLTQCDTVCRSNSHPHFFVKIVMCGRRSKAQGQMKTLLLYKENKKMSRALKLISNVCAVILSKATFEIFLTLTFLPLYQSSSLLSLFKK